MRLSTNVRRNLAREEDEGSVDQYKNVVQNSANNQRASGSSSNNRADPNDDDVHLANRKAVLDFGEQNENQQNEEDQSASNSPSNMMD